MSNFGLVFGLGFGFFAPLQLCLPQVKDTLCVLGEAQGDENLLEELHASKLYDREEGLSYTRGARATTLAVQKSFLTSQDLLEGACSYGTVGVPGFLDHAVDVDHQATNLSISINSFQFISYLHMNTFSCKQNNILISFHVAFRAEPWAAPLPGLCRVEASSGPRHRALTLHKAAAVRKFLTTSPSC